MTTIVTGSAGFIGHALCEKLLKRGDNILGIDNHNDYYDPRIKDARIKRLAEYTNYKHFKVDLSDRQNLDKVFKESKIKKVVNLAAQAGVRYSMENPLAYINSNIVGFANILENCRYNNVDHLVYASTSSVYGANTKIPFSEHDSVNHQLSVYAASKKSNELMAHSYSYLYKLPTTGLRFFTVYGPWGRPDMALFKFTENILVGKSIDVFNHGKHTRDFTYIDDIVDGVIKALDNSAESNIHWDSNQPDPATSKAPWRIYNIGNNKSVQLMDYIAALEKNLKKKFNYKPSTSVFEGVSKFVNWYKDYYKNDL